MRYRKYIGPALVVLFASPVILHVLAAVVPGVESYVVASGSMAPTITTGSLVYTAETGDYGVGDVVTFRRGGTTVTHRIVEVRADGYVTKGDANDGRDATVPPGQVVGEVVASVPLYGHFFAVAATPLGYGLLVVVPGLLLVAMEIRDHVHE